MPETPATAVRETAERRAADDAIAALVARLDLEQKVRLLTGADFWALHAEPAVGLRRMVTSDGPAGVRGERWDERDPSVNIPSPTALAASFDPTLVEEVGGLLAHEARRKGVDVVLAPTVNLHRSPYGGRHFECFSEDPVLTGVTGAALVRGLQSHGVAATVKHFVANDSETERLTVDARVDERTLREVYLAPFETIVRDAGVWAVMAAYSSLNGTTMTESPLLTSVLREEWGFDGVTMTDWYAGRSTDAAADAGLDLVMPGPTGPWGEALVQAVRAGRVSEAAVDEKVGRLLRLAGRVGALADRSSLGSPSPSTEDEAAGLARRAAAAGTVLLRNAEVDGAPVLPLDPARTRRLAVIGPNALEPRFLGGGSALVFPARSVSAVAGLRAALGGDVEVAYSLGTAGHERVSAADPALLSTSEGGRGVRLEFRGAGGRVLGVDHRPGSAFNWNNAFEGVDPALITEIALDTVVTADVDGHYRVGVSGVGRFRLRLDDQPVFDVPLTLPADADPVEGLMRPPQEWTGVDLAAGQSVRVALTHEVREHEPGEDLLVSFQLAVDRAVVDPEDTLAHAVEVAAAAEVAVVVVGTSEEVESEGFDRTDLALPGRQDELVRRVATACPRTVVVVNSGAPVLLPWREEVAAILLSWFPGQEFGHALADVVLGRVEPGGRLPTTWPADERRALPTTTPSGGRLDYAEGLHVGHRRFLRDEVAPAYWFGHGLGYTTWRYDRVEARAATDGGAEVVVTLTNDGPRAGRQPVQVYLSRPESRLERPRRWLGGFAVAEAEPGASTTVRVALARRTLEHWDVAASGWAIEPGSVRVEVGRSAGDIELTAVLDLDPDLDPDLG